MAPRLLLLAAAGAAVLTPAAGRAAGVAPRSEAVDAALDCGVRALALRFGSHLAPHAAGLVFDALRLGAECNQTRPAPPAPAAPAALDSPAFARTYYVDAVRGSDGNAGTLAAPFQTLPFGVAAARAGAQPAQLLLRDTGVFFLSAPLLLTPADNGLSIAAYPGEAPVLSGGVPLSGLSWTRGAPAPSGGMSGPWAGVSVVSNTPGLVPGGSVPGVIAYAGSFAAVDGCAAACAAAGACGSYTWHDQSVTGGWATQCFLRVDGAYAPQGGFPGHFTGRKVPSVDATQWSARVPAGTPAFDNLYSLATGRRLTRAKAPNGNPETTIDGFAGGATAWAPPQKYPPPTDVNIAAPSRAGDPYFATYQYGTGGTCAIFEPAGGFWCSSNPPAGSTFNVPSGVTLPPGLLPGNWSEASNGAIFHAFHGERWGDWKFAVDAADAAAGTLSWTYGGFQEARGAGSGDTFMLENMRELLDAYDEFYLDARAGELVIMFNNSAPPPSLATALVATQLDSLVRVMGTAAAPVVGVALSGLTFAHSAPTFMKPFTMASGGDWSVRRDAALVLNGTVGATVQGCAFVGIGGNAVLLSGFNRGATVANSTFRYVGDSAIVSLGNVDGMNGTALDCPIGSIIAYNVMAELGLYVKQSGGYYHALSGNATVVGNVFFNMPRAAVNINDGFMGGHNIAHNLCFNAVRETSDHGCINSWDREPYITRTGADSLLPAPTLIERNFLINNYHSTWSLDHDDGSNAFFDRFNFCAWSGAKQYLGFDKHFSGNMWLYADANMPTTPRDTGFSPYCYGAAGEATFSGALRDSFVNETCVVMSPGALYNLHCDSSAPQNGYVPVLSGNTIYIDSGDYVFNCGSNAWTLAEAQANGFDVGTVVLPTPDTATLLAMATSFVEANLMTPVHVGAGAWRGQRSNQGH